MHELYNVRACADRLTRCAVDDTRIAVGSYGSCSHILNFDTYKAQES